jgi:hypothetical protein
MRRYRAALGLVSFATIAAVAAGYRDDIAAAWYCSGRSETDPLGRPEIDPPGGLILTPYERS